MINIIKTIKDSISSAKEKNTLFDERLLVCSSCAYFKDKCTRCSCPGAGIIRNLNSRCPDNKWKDGWGEYAPPPLANIDTHNDLTPNMVFWDDDSSAWISAEDFYLKNPFLKPTNI